MKKRLLVLFIGTFCFSAIGQYALPEKQLDSLNQLLLRAKEDTTKVDLLFQLGIAHQYIGPNKSADYFNRGLDLSRKLESKDRILGGLLTLGFLYSRIGEPAKAIDLLQESLRYCEETKKDPTMSLAFISYSYEAQGDLKNAIEFSRKSFLIYEQERKDGIIVIDRRGYPAGPMRMGQLFEKVGQLDSAMHYAQMAYQRVLEPSNIEEMVFFYCQICNLLATIHSRLNQLDDAIHYYRLAHNKAIEVNYKTAVQESQLGLAQYYYKINNADSVIHYATQAYAGSKEVKGYDVMKTSAALLRLVYEKQGTYAKALYYNDLATAARDSVSGAEKVREVASLTHKEEQRQLKIQQEAEAARVAYENKVRTYALLAILGGVALLATVLYRNNRQKQNANALLHKQKAEIDLQRSKAENALLELKTTQTQLIQKEKMASLGELTAGIAHEIQNPLNFVNNFSELSVDLVKDLKEEIEKPEQDKAYIGELFDDLSQNQEKINHHGKRASSIVKGMLEHSRASTGVKEMTDINKLADEYLRLSYHGMRAKDNSFNADFITDFDENLPKIEVIPQDIGRVLLNLINNAFYAVNQRKLLSSDESYTPSVSVTTKQLENAIEVRVKDNGKGMPESVKAKVFQPFFTTKPTGQGTGLGLSLAYDIVTKGHGGTLEVNSTDGTSRDNREGVGSEFIITLPFKTNKILK